MSFVAYFLGGSQDLSKKTMTLPQPDAELIYFRNVKVDDLIDDARIIRPVPEKEVYRLLGQVPNQPAFIYVFVGTRG